MLEKAKEKAPEKVILFAPTWQRNIAGVFDAVLGKHAYSETFKESNYFKITNSFINSPKLINEFKENGYKLKFVSHPSMKRQDEDYQLNEVVSFTSEKYSDLISQSAAMITDFSSVHYDVVFLKKPVFYLDIENDSVKKYHISKEYDWEIKQPFGDLYSTVDALVDLIEHDKLEMSPKYQVAVDDIFEAIMDL
ncbi:hypothetical protein Hs30E_16350 [Lactococcus hodotermopsidis]|uniref:Uncharacterized protein n=1 Tax=Pseudolactococcus hodotermopsidis TaxID=2709157 RepID=A0A6A0BF59_9LACT|nr:hypothetical protein Hs30E_16350 [Lactococcus hodotermopsidis]